MDFNQILFYPSSPTLDHSNNNDVKIQTTENSSPKILRSRRQSTMPPPEVVADDAIITEPPKGSDGGGGGGRGRNSSNLHVSFAEENDQVYSKIVLVT